MINMMINDDDQATDEEIKELEKELEMRKRTEKKSIADVTAGQKVIEKVIDAKEVTEIPSAIIDPVDPKIMKTPIWKGTPKEEFTDPPSNWEELIGTDSSISKAGFVIEDGKVNEPNTTIKGELILDLDIILKVVGSVDATVFLKLLTSEAIASFFIICTDSESTQLPILGRWIPSQTDELSISVDKQKRFIKVGFLANYYPVAFEMELRL